MLLEAFHEPKTSSYWIDPSVLYTWLFSEYTWIEIAQIWLLPGAENLWLLSVAGVGVEFWGYLDT